MQVNVAGLRRAAKNIAHNYTDPQKKVREATSNDHWGPSSTLMSEIADLTYNIEAFSQIMEMLWKRLNDHGKNWRHVYKSLVLLEYLIKTGSERVGQQCKENIFAIQTLKDFQHLEDNKDQGLNVREKAKQLVVLLSSEEKLRNERTRALKARERFAQTISGFGSSGEDGSPGGGTSPVFSMGNSFGVGSSERSAVRSSRSNPELEQARPQTAGEEELQLQLALAMSKEEADQEEKRRRSDELRLQMALSQSEQEFKGPLPPNVPSTSHGAGASGSAALVDLLDVDLGFGSNGSHGLGNGNLELLGAVGGVPAATQQDPWNIQQNTKTADIGWNTNAVNVDPWNPINNANTLGNTLVNDPWAPAPKAASAQRDLADFDMDSDAFAKPNVPKQNSNAKSSPHSFLGENSGLVNLDNLITPTTTNVVASPFLQPNPFSGSANPTSSPIPNPFHANPVQKPSINELRGASGGRTWDAAPVSTVDPWSPSNNLA